MLHRLSKTDRIKRDQRIVKLHDDEGLTLTVIA